MRAAISTVKFAAGLVANLLCQSARSAFNLFSCLVLFASCTVLFALAALQLSGGGDKKAAESAAKGYELAKRAILSGFNSALQALGVITLLSPLMRAAQACSEKIAPRGIICPVGKNRSFFQEALGINSWDQEDEAPKPQPKSKPTTIDAAKPKKAKPAKRQRNKSNEDGWERLVQEYLSADTLRKMDDILARMAVEHPSRYAFALARAQCPKRSRQKAA